MESEYDTRNILKSILINYYTFANVYIRAPFLLEDSMETLAATIML